jgi:hypothetical protein
LRLIRTCVTLKWLLGRRLPFELPDVEDAAAVVVLLTGVLDPLGDPLLEGTV